MFRIDGVAGETRRRTSNSRPDRSFELKFGGEKISASSLQPAKFHQNCINSSKVIEKSKPAHTCLAHPVRPVEQLYNGAVQLIFYTELH